MLYEVITGADEPRLFHGLGCFRHDGGRRPVRIEDRAADMGHVCFAVFSVITSYSIHYTKLYEHRRGQCINPPRLKTRAVAFLILLLSKDNTIKRLTLVE